MDKTKHYSKPLIVIFVITLIFLIIGCFKFIGSLDFVPEIKESEVKQKIIDSGKLPYTSKSGYLNVNDVEFSFEKDTINVGFTAEYERFGKSFTLDVSGATGEPTLKGHDIYVKPEALRLTGFTIDGRKITEADIIGTVAEQANGFKKRLFDKFGLKSKTDLTMVINQEASAEALSDLKIQALSYAENAAKEFMSRTPVYSLPNDMKGTLVSAAIEKIDIEKGFVTIEFSILNLMIAIVWIAIPFIICISIGIYIIRHPKKAAKAAGDIVDGIADGIGNMDINIDL